MNLKNKKFNTRRLLQVRGTTIKNKTAFKAKIMLENNETWKEISKIRKKQVA